MSTTNLFRVECSWFMQGGDPEPHHLATLGPWPALPVGRSKGSLHRHLGLPVPPRSITAAPRPSTHRVHTAAAQTAVWLLERRWRDRETRISTC
jgi:hypothetical protein